ncbi:MAG TPA: hypothetical protein PLY98_02155 [Candidatus Paceibacterota bacterium]|nr:MAG: hypothetical protein BWX82_00590 [Parcubacteria group bacterium ADurb.Bin115]HQM18895.1 hypothetical protein [Candidatus Paceibacterota bacterium]
MDDKELSKLIWGNEAALKENLLLTREALEIRDTIIKYLNSVLDKKSLPGLRLRKITSNATPDTWWSDNSGFPTDNAWKRMEKYINIFQQYLAEKTIKKRISDDQFFIESRIQGEDQHILVGKRDGSGSKAHIVIDGSTGEIRVEDNQQAPEEVTEKIETVIKLPNGKQIRTTREILEFVADE